MQIPSSHLSAQKENAAIRKKILPPALSFLATAAQGIWIDIKR